MNLHGLFAISPLTRVTTPHFPTSHDGSHVSKYHDGQTIALFPGQKGVNQGGYAIKYSYFINSGFTR